MQVCPAFLSFDVQQYNNLCYTIHCLPVTRYMIHCLAVTHTEQGQNVERHALQGTTQMASVWVQQQCAFAVRHAAQGNSSSFPAMPTQTPNARPVLHHACPMAMPPMAWWEAVPLALTIEMQSSVP